jgi:glycosyltransferase involved in cell wall biosynthesis
MWGVKPKSITRTFDRNNFNILFVGLIKESQGLEFFYDFLKENKEYKLKIIGVCEKKLYTKYMSIIKRYDISDRVYFPNKFFSDKELNEISEECQIGIALYDANKSSVTYYADPGKVKAYAELGLPIIMSNIPSVAPYIRKFNAGEIVDRNEISLRNALKKIRDNYQKYIDGVNKFNRYFYFEDYYKRRFKFLEKVA